MSKPKSRYPILENLFNSKVRVKVLKFLFRNYPAEVRTGELAKRLQEPLGVIKKEVNSLMKMGLIKRS